MSLVLISLTGLTLNGLTDNDDTIHLLLGLLFSIIGCVVVEFYRQLKGHISTCSKRAEESSSKMQWIGDSIHIIGDKVGASLPPRPNSSSKD